MKIVGVQKSDYTNKEGRHVSGYNVYFTCEQSNVVGMYCGSEWLRSEYGDQFFGKFKDLKDCIGIDFVFETQRYGRYNNIVGIRSL